METLMSRGPGKIERAILAAFEFEPDNAFTVEDICDRVYSGANRVEKTHRVSIGRAMRSCAAKSDDFALLHSGLRGNAIIIFRRHDIPSFEMAAMKANPHHIYRSSSRWLGITYTPKGSVKDQEDRFREQIAKSAGYGPNDPWRYVFDLAGAIRDGDVDRAAKLRESIRGQFIGHYWDRFGSFDAMLGNGAYDLLAAGKW